MVIQIEALSFDFDQTRAVDALTLSVGKGEVFGLLGHNGAGKTTTIRLLNGVLQAKQGSIRVMGHDPIIAGAAIRSRTGVLTETPSLDERLSARQNLRFYADLYGMPAMDIGARIEAMLTTFNLSERGDEKVGAYSKGMKQRLAIARALLHDPDLVFLDEPTSGLDPVSIQQVHEIIRRLSADEGRTVFICTHNLVEAQRLCHRVGVMQQGRLIALGTPAELAAQTQSEIRYDIELAPGQAAAACARVTTVDGVLRATGDAEMMTVAVTDRDVISDVLMALLQGGLRVYAVTPQAATLEDVYLALHGKDA